MSLKNAPELYSQELEMDPIVHARFYTLSGCNWLITEYDGTDLCFGLADLNMGFPELGYFSLSEFDESNEILFQNKQYSGIVLEDKTFKPMKLSEVKSALCIE